MRRRGIQRFALSFALAAIMALVFAGVAFSGTAKKASASFGVGAKGTVVFYQRAATNGAAAALVPEFNASHPGLKVVVVQTSPNDDTSTLATAIRAGHPPDLVGLNDIDVPEFTSENALLNLSKYIKALPNLKYLSHGHLALGFYKGGEYAVPYLADLSVLWYNKTLFAKAGLNGPPTSYAAMVSDANAVQKLGGGVSGISFAGGCQGCLGFVMEPDLWADKNYMITGAIPKQKINITGNSDLTALLQAYQTMWKNGDAPTNDQTDNGATWGDDFASGNIGLYPGPYGKYPAFVASGNIKEFGIAPLPGMNGNASTFDGGDDFVIPKGAKNASGAWEFVKWMLQPQIQVQYPGFGYTPVLTNILTPSFKKDNPYDAVALKALATGYAPTTLIYDQAYNEPNSPWFTMFTDAVYNNNISGGEAAAQSGFEQLLKSTNSGT
ncbi:MAG TPA: extracellular solute-binding protein [Solirubrobacteraceae bacterium]|nr:extracellular solute-binding protein [Solirubrobacteraceae bacterium]